MLGLGEGGMAERWLGGVRWGWMLHGAEGDRVEVGKMGDGSTGWVGRGEGWSGAGGARGSETIDFQLLLINQ